MANKFFPPSTLTEFRENVVPISGEIFYDLEQKQLYYGDGVTKGGKRVLDLPDIKNNANKYLYTDGLNLIWADSESLNLDLIPEFELKTKDITLVYNTENRTVEISNNIDKLQFFWNKTNREISLPITTEPHDISFGLYFLVIGDGESLSWVTNIEILEQKILIAVAFFQEDISFLLNAINTPPTPNSFISNSDDIHLRSGGDVINGSFLFNSDNDEHLKPKFEEAFIFTNQIIKKNFEKIEEKYTHLILGQNNSYTFSTNNSFPFKISEDTNLLQLNNNGNFFSASNKFFYNIYRLILPVTEDTSSNIFSSIWIQPQRNFNTLNGALNEKLTSLNLGDFINFPVEYLIANRITLLVDENFNSSGKVKIIEITSVPKIKLFQIKKTYENETDAENIKFSSSALIPANNVNDAINYINSAIHSSQAEPIALQNAGIRSGFFTTNSDDEDQVIFSLDGDICRTAKFLIQVLNEGQYQSTEILCVHSNGIVSSTEYATIYTSNPLCFFNLDYMGGLLRLKATPLQSSPTTIRFICQNILA